jgi:hypothetical protein
MLTVSETRLYSVIGGSRSNMRLVLVLWNERATATEPVQ